MKQVTRQILHIDLDSFFVAVEQLLNPQLLGKPVIIGGDSDRGVVSTCSYEARKFGVHSAMSIAKAKQLCPHAIYISGNYSQYSHYSKLVTQLIIENAPLAEKASIDEFYIDLTGMDIYYNALQFSKDLRKKIVTEIGLPVSFGLSTNKTVSKIATDFGKPNGETYVAPGEEKKFLAPLHVKKIPFVGEKTYSILQKIGIEYVHQLQKTSLSTIHKYLGENGKSIWQKANGICYNEVVPYHERKSISNETTFDIDTNDKKYLKEIIDKLIDELGYTLRKEKKLTACIAIKLKNSNFQVQSQQITIPPTNVDKVLMQQAYQLLNNLHNEQTKYRLIGIRYSSLTDGEKQMDLFNNYESDQKVNKAVDDIRKKFGKDIITKASYKSNP